MGRAEDLFERVVSGGEAAIDQFIADRQAEELFLDFKRSADNGCGTRLHDSDRSNLARAISGFGNSEGGILVWGVDCRDVSGSGDVARAKVPLVDSLRFRSRLEGAVSGCTVPAHPGVRSHAISRGDNTGFVVTLIPRSFLAPHQSLKPLQYFMRAGSDFQPVPHAVLRGLFGRSPQASMFHMWMLQTPRYSPIVGDLAAIELKCGLLLSSHGPGLVRDIFVNAVLFAPDGHSEAAFGVADSNNWDARVIFGTRINLVSKEQLKLAPEAIVQPLVISFKLTQPFRSPLSYEIVYGYHGSPTSKLSVAVQADELTALFGQLQRERNAIPDRDVYARALGIQEDAVLAPF